MITVALDAMGGDKAPEVVIKGAIQAAGESNGDFSIILTGPEKLIKSQLQKTGYSGSLIEIVDAPQIVNMDESPTDAIRNKPHSGLVTAVTLQKSGRAQASVSAGNSGAMMAACLTTLGRLGSISRPAIVCEMPTLKKDTVVLDCGANVDEKPVHLLHFAISGSIYAECILGRNNPTVALLNIGEEEKKGPELIQETHKILKSSKLNFVGNVEGRDITNGDVDVIVTPGYTGNVVLKLMEGFYEITQKLFGSVNTPEMKKFSREWNYSNKGGAPLLGLNGTGVITHGRADSLTIKMAVITAFKLVRSQVSEKIGQILEELD